MGLSSTYPALFHNIQNIQMNISLDSDVDRGLLHLIHFPNKLDGHWPWTYGDGKLSKFSCMTVRNESTNFNPPDGNGDEINFLGGNRTGWHETRPFETVTVTVDALSMGAMRKGKQSWL